MPGMKAFYVIIMITNWHGHNEQHARPAGWMTEHQCHEMARRVEMQHFHTHAWCERENHH